MKLHIHSNYTELEPLIRQIPTETYPVEQVYRNQRNLVEKIRMEGELFVLKKYKIPSLFNRIVYTWFRKSKARRAFEYAVKLVQLGVETAHPVAYIEESRNGLFSVGYFISEYLPYPTMDQLGNLTPEEQEQVMTQFLNFTIGLHERKIVHQDYNPGNILYHKQPDGTYSFAYVDINRMSFNKNGLKLCLQAIDHFGLDIDNTCILARRYAEARNLDPLTCIIIVLKRRKRIRRQRQVKAFFRDSI